MRISERIFKQFFESIWSVKCCQTFYAAESARFERKKGSELEVMMLVEIFLVVFVDKHLEHENCDKKFT